MMALIVSVPATFTASALAPWSVSCVAVVPSPVTLKVDPAGVWLKVIPPNEKGEPNSTIPPRPLNTAVSPLPKEAMVSLLDDPSHQLVLVVFQVPLPPRF